VLSLLFPINPGSGPNEEYPRNQRICHAFVGAALAAIQPSSVQADGCCQGVQVSGIIYRQIFQTPKPAKRPKGALLVAAKAAPTIEVG
jgi:hypothetical protein